MYPKFVALRNSLSTKCKYLYVQLRLVSLLDSPDISRYITSSEGFPVKLNLCCSSDCAACNKFMDVKRTGRFWWKTVNVLLHTEYIDGNSMRQCCPKNINWLRGKQKCYDKKFVIFICNLLITLKKNKHCRVYSKKWRLL